MTNLLPAKIIEDDEGNLLWLEQDFDLSNQLENFINKTVDYLPSNRHKDISSFKYEISSIQEKQRNYFFKKSYLLIVFLSKITLISLTVTTSLYLANILGLMRPLELLIYDHFLRIRPRSEGADVRLLIIGITGDDLLLQKELGIRDDGSLSDEALELILRKIAPFNPSVVGLDIFRDNALPVSADSNLIAICSHGSKIEAPPGLGVEQIGFADMAEDFQVSFYMRPSIRRALLRMNPDSSCQTSKSFSYLVAEKYLSQKNLKIKLSNRSSERKSVILNGNRIDKLSAKNFLYEDLDASGYQVILNYRSSNSPFKLITLRELLSDNFTEQDLLNLIQNKVVLIGTIDRSYRDFHDTPYGIRSGVQIHAHVISQIISTALDDRKSLSYVSFQQVALVIICTSSFSVIVGFATQEKTSLNFCLLTLIVLIYFLCLMCFMNGLILPLFSMSIASASSCIFSRKLRFS